MKLHHKTLLYLLLVAMPVAVVGGWLFYVGIEQSIQYEIDEQLRSDLNYARRQLQQTGFSDATRQLLPGDWQLAPAQPGETLPPVFSDTTRFDSQKNEIVPVRQLSTTVAAGSKTYRLTVSQAVDEFGEIATRVSVGVVGSFLGLLLVLVVANAWVSRRLWKPFYALVHQLRQYRLDSPRHTAFADSNITEFRQLSAAFDEMGRNLNQQYLAQKQFTDHAAHEMQTPLALVSTELDGLLRDASLTSPQLHHIERAQEAIDRLNRLNKSLLLLTKIDNRQFIDHQPIDVSTLVHKLTDSYAEFARHRSLGWQVSVSPGVVQSLNPYLAEVLFSNLLKNAILHSPAGSTVCVDLTPTHLLTQNDGPPLPFAPERVFDRFVKDPARPDSTGLGLALVRQIARRYGMQEHYRYDGRHTFAIKFA